MDFFVAWLLEEFRPMPILCSVTLEAVESTRSLKVSSRLERYHVSRVCVLTTMGARGFVVVIDTRGGNAPQGTYSLDAIGGGVTLLRILAETQPGTYAPSSTALLLLTPSSTTMAPGPSSPVPDLAEWADAVLSSSPAAWHAHPSPLAGLEAGLSLSPLEGGVDILWVFSAPGDGTGTLSASCSAALCDVVDAVEGVGWAGPSPVSLALLSPGPTPPASPQWRGGRAVLGEVAAVWGEASPADVGAAMLEVGAQMGGFQTIWVWVDEAAGAFPLAVEEKKKKGKEGKGASGPLRLARASHVGEDVVGRAPVVGRAWASPKLVDMDGWDALAPQLAPGSMVPMASVPSGMTFGQLTADSVASLPPSHALWFDPESGRLALLSLAPSTGFDTPAAHPLITPPTSVPGASSRISAYAGLAAESEADPAVFAPLTMVFPPLESGSKVYNPEVKSPGRDLAVAFLESLIRQGVMAHPSGIPKSVAETIRGDASRMWSIRGQLSEPDQVSEFMAIWTEVVEAVERLSSHYRSCASTLLQLAGWMKSQALMAQSVGSQSSGAAPFLDIPGMNFNDLPVVTVDSGSDQDDDDDDDGGSGGGGHHGGGGVEGGSSRGSGGRVSASRLSLAQIQERAYLKNEVGKRQQYKRRRPPLGGGAGAEEVAQKGGKRPKLLLDVLFSRS